MNRYSRVAKEIYHLVHKYATEDFDLSDVRMLSLIRGAIPEAGLDEAKYVRVMAFRCADYPRDAFGVANQDGLAMILSDIADCLSRGETCKLVYSHRIFE